MIPTAPVVDSRRKQFEDKHDSCTGLDFFIVIFIGRRDL
jgi:hypothetical protein